MKKTGFILISSMLLLMNSCSETLPLEPNGSGGEVAVRFTATMQPSVEIMPTRAMIDKLPTAQNENVVGVYGVLTPKQEVAAFEWQTGVDIVCHEQMENKQYLIEEGYTLSPANGKVDYHPSRTTSALAIYAYWPYSDEMDADGYIPVNVTEQRDLLYTGKVESALNEMTHEFDPVELPFRHAMGAVAFRFYTDDFLSPLVGTVISSITLNTNYSTEGVKMRIADGTFATTGTSGVHIYHPQTEIKAEKTEEIVAAQMMPADGESLQITSIGLMYTTNGNETKTATISGTWTLRPGAVQVLNIRCTQKSEAPTLVVDKSTYTTRSTAPADSEITFTLEQITTE